MPDKKLIHYHSECRFFAGCEHMLTNFFNSKSLRERYDLSFSYAYSKEYENSLGLRLKEKLLTYKLKLPLFPEIKSGSKFTLIFKKIIRIISIFFLFYPLFIYQILFFTYFFKKINPSILHINNGGYPGALSARAAALGACLAGVPKILMVVNNMAIEYGHYSRWLDFPIDRLVAKSTDLFITGSKAASYHLKGVLRLQDLQVHSIPNGISLFPARKDASETKVRLGVSAKELVLFGVVALLIPRKGHLVLLKAVLDLALSSEARNIKYKILIEGSGPLLKILSDFVIEKNLSQWVCFVGEERNIADFISALDVLILPSVREEDFPNVILEAMALGKPVIATSIAGIPEQVIDGFTGLLVDAYSVKKLADAIYQLAISPQTRYAMGHEGRQRFYEYFTADIAVSNYQILYDKLSGGDDVNV